MNKRNKRKEARKRVQRVKAGQWVDGVILNDDGSAVVNVYSQTFIFKNV